MRASVDEVFQKYGDRIFSAAFSVCRNRADADDVVQDTLIRYYSVGAGKDFESEAHLKAWLLREEYMDELPFAEPEDSGLFEAVMGLPEKYRTVIHLFYYEEYTVEEIAHILRRPGGTVKSQLNRGRTLLKNILQEGWNDDE